MLLLRSAGCMHVNLTFFSVFTWKCFLTALLLVHERWFMLLGWSLEEASELTDPVPAEVDLEG